MQAIDPTRPLVILDFETSGMSPAQGARAIEIGAVLVREGQIVDRFQSLMNPGFLIDSFIENFTGISNRLLREAPPSAEAMEACSEFIADQTTHWLPTMPPSTASFWTLSWKGSVGAAPWSLVAAC